MTAVPVCGTCARATDMTRRQHLTAQVIRPEEHGRVVLISGVSHGRTTTARRPSETTSIWMKGQINRASTKEPAKAEMSTRSLIWAIRVLPTCCLTDGASAPNEKLNPESTYVPQRPSAALRPSGARDTVAFVGCMRGLNGSGRRPSRWPSPTPQPGHSDQRQPERDDQRLSVPGPQQEYNQAHQPKALHRAGHGTCQVVAQGGGPIPGQRTVEEAEHKRHRGRHWWY